MRTFLLNIIVWPCIWLGYLSAYATVGFQAGKLAAASHMKKYDIK